MKRIALFCLLAIGCSRGPTTVRGPRVVMADSSGQSQLTLQQGALVGVPAPNYKTMFLDTSGALTLMDSTGARTAIGGGDTGAQSTMSIAMTRAQALLGSTLTSIGGADFYHAGDFTSSLIGSGTVALSNTDRSGVVKVSTGATTSSGATALMATSASQIDNSKTGLFYVVWRAALVTAGDGLSSQALRIVGNVGSTIYQIGVRGPTSATFISVFVTDDGGTNRANVTTAVAADTNYHTFEIWNDGTNLNFTIDGAVINQTATSVLASGGPAHLDVNCVNGSTAANRQINVDYAWIVTAPN